ncbi:hypothetical protein NDU88_002007 [Pleurodeles waltl]|uniref:Uncharacterized protein n=1 Tax=Pleurodeles waltl TaxID=8319 RepID=A0AAV7PCV5_PLEWA|nr:hypothetical protein NDU88_002007 [Pleurodeles waltl]
MAGTAARPGETEAPNLSRKRPSCADESGLGIAGSCRVRRQEEGAALAARSRPCLVRSPPASGLARGRRGRRAWPKRTTRQILLGAPARVNLVPA